MPPFFILEKENRIKEISLLENAINLYGYFEYTQKSHCYLKIVVSSKP